LRDLYLEGKSTAYLADRFSTSIENVRQRLSRMDVKRPASEARGPSPARPQAAPGDLAEAIRVILGTVPPHERPEAHVPPEALPEVIRSYQAFNERVLGIDHPTYQRDCIRAILGEPLVAIVKGRQIGATQYVIAPAVVYFAFTRPYTTVLITSLTMRQATYVLTRIKNLIAGNAALKRSLVDVSLERLRLSNGSEVLSLPSGVDGSSLRGYSPSLAIVDEAAFVPDRAIQDALLPSLAVTGGALVVVSTPWGVGSYFYRCARENPAFKVLEIPSSRSPFIPPGFLEARRLDTDPLSYRTEYLGEFVASADAYFSHESIKAAIRDYELRDSARDGPVSCFAGVDWGRKVDSSVVAVVERDDSVEPSHLRLVHLKEFFETPYTQVVGYVKVVAESFRVRRVLADTGAGLAQIDSLKEARVPVEGFAFTLGSKADLMSNLKLALENRQLDLPDHRRLLLQLSAFEYSISEAGNLRLHGKHDDLVDALALAAYAARRRPGKPGFVAVTMPGLGRFLGPEPVRGSRLPPPRPRPCCVKCKGEIPPGQVAIGREGRQHAGRCPPGPA